MRGGLIRKSKSSVKEKMNLSAGGVTRESSYAEKYGR